MTDEWDGENDVTPKGSWESGGVLNPGTIHVSTDDRIELEVSFYHGADDGKPVIQIDGDADFRINVNDAPIWDQAPDNGWVIDTIHEYFSNIISADEALGIIGRTLGILPEERED